MFFRQWWPLLADPICLCTIGSTSKWMEKQTNVKSHLFCFMSFVILSSVTHPPFAVLLLWDLYLGPQQHPQSLPALLLHLQPEARLGELLLLPEKIYIYMISRNNWNPLYSCKCPGFSGFLYSLQLTSHTFCLPVASILGRKWKIFSPMQQSFKLFPPGALVTVYEWPARIFFVNVACFLFARTKGEIKGPANAASCTVEVKTVGADIRVPWFQFKCPHLIPMWFQKSYLNSVSPSVLVFFKWR